MSTLGDGREKTRVTHLYGPGGKTIGLNREIFRVDFVSKRFLTSLQNNNLPSPPWWRAWREGYFTPKTGARPDPLDPQDWVVQGADHGRALVWPELLHWRANGFANVWWIEPDLVNLLKAQGYTRPSPGGGQDMEVLIEFRPQRFYLLGLGLSGATVAVCLLIWLACLVRAKKGAARA